MGNIEDSVELIFNNITDGAETLNKVRQAERQKKNRVKTAGEQ